MTPGSRFPLLALLLVSLAIMSTSLLATTARAAGPCVTALPVTATFESPYAAAYHRTLPVRVTTSGPAVRNLTVALYTFGGQRVAFGRAHGSLTGTATVAMKLRYRAMQAGRFTLVLDGEPNADASCGPKHRYRVVSFLDCPSTLPVTLTAVPGAADRVSVSVAAGRSMLRRVTVTLSPIGGPPVGTRTIRNLFGATTVSFPAAAGSGGYSVTASGRVAGQPTACVDATRSLVLAAR